MQQLIYAWDGYGNLEQRCDVNRSLAENVTDDDLNRLTGSTVYTGVSVSGSTCVGGSTTNTLSASYDPMGNILSKSNVGSTYKYDRNHPYAVDTVKNSSGTTVYSASYDNNSNMITRNGYTIGWTTDNLPESMASATGSSTFNYGPDHDRYYQSAYNGVTTDTTYVGGLFEVVSSTGTTEYRHNIMANGQVIAVHTIDGNGTPSTSYLHYDHLGSVDAITNNAGTVIQSMSFDAFGERRDASNWDYDLTPAQIALLKNNTDRGYTFQEQLDNVGLVHMNGRVYDPTIGRFISADPAMQFPYFSQNFDRYSYVFNDPLSFTDPSGYDLCLSEMPDNGGAFVWDVFGTSVGGSLGAYVGGAVGGVVGAIAGSEVPVAGNIFGAFAGATTGGYLGGVGGAAGGAFLAHYLYDKFCSTPKIPPQILPKPQPSKHVSPKPPAPPISNPPSRSSSGGGGGGENGNGNRNPGSISVPVVCTTTYYDIYVDHKYVGSGDFSTQCQ